MQFFAMDEPLTVDLTYDAWASGMKPKHQGDPHRCPQCNEFFGMLRWLPPYNAEIVVRGQLLGDVVEGSGWDMLVSERFRNAWQQEGLRGITDFSPLQRLRIRPARLGRKPLTYFHVEPSHFGTRIDPERSRVEYNRPATCPLCKQAGIDSIRGFTIDESSWTGEDLFLVWGLQSTIVVTDRVRQLRDDYGLTNMNLIPVEKYFLDFYYRWSVIDYSRDVEPEPDDDSDQDSNATN